MEILSKWIFFFFILLHFEGFAQHKLNDIPIVNIEDYKAAPQANSKFPVYTNSRVYYRIDTVIQQSENVFNVKIATKVELYGDRSFWDRKKVKNDAIPRMLNHEQGHFYIAHIAANIIETEIFKSEFTKNWQEEVKKKFHELNDKLSQIDVKYDEETLHSRNLKAQEKWDKWIRQQLQ